MKLTALFLGLALATGLWLLIFMFAVPVLVDVLAELTNS